MKLSEILYQRPNLEAIEKEIAVLCEKFEKASDFNVQLEAVNSLNDLQIDFESAAAIASIRHNFNTSNEFYEKEEGFFNQSWPRFSAALLPYYQLLLQSRFRAELEEHLGKHLFRLAQHYVDEVNPKTVGIEQKINHLTAEYNKLAAQGIITFKGDQHPLPAIYSFMNDQNRSVRKEAQDTYSSFWKSKQTELNKLFDELVKLRHQKAQTLGFENYAKLAYHRNDYDNSQITAFNKNVCKHILPLRTRLYNRWRKRLGVEKLYYYDNQLFKNGSPKPQIDAEDMLVQAQKMYAELSPETDVFYQFMRKNELMEVEIREGKYPGAYHRPITKYKLPFIHANFDGTEYDFHTLTHELGHAFQSYQTRKSGVNQLEYMGGLADISEIHSIGMELFTWKWYSLFFKEDTVKYQFSKISGLLGMIVSCCLGEDFQQFIYKNPQASKNERNQKWLELDCQYYPYYDRESYYEDNEYQKSGQNWHENAHLFLYPFYMVDYSLATICAVQLWMKAQNDWEGAWEDYLQLCKIGGKHSYFESLQLANLRSPFDENVIKEVANFLSEWLDRVDDREF